MNTRIPELIEKDFSEDLTDTEKESLSQWETAEGNKQYYTFLKGIRLGKSIEVEAENMRNGILDNVHKKMEASRKKYSIGKIISIAASVLLIMGISSLIYFIEGEDKESNWLTRSNPSGTRSEFRLPDGSTVFLNGASEITYPEKFNEKKRVVSLVGEAYFKVERIESLPFVVQCKEGVEVEVLGTTFNVENFEDDNIMKVTLETGSVGVNFESGSGNIILLPNQQASYNKISHRVAINNVEASDVTAWTTGKYYFNAISLKYVAKKLERHFDVNIRFLSEELGNTIYTLDFGNDETIDDILNILSMDERIKYKKEENIITFY